MLSSVRGSINYCNAVLASAPKYVTSRLQRALNAVSRLVCCTRKFDRGLSRLGVRSSGRQTNRATANRATNRLVGLELRLYLSSSNQSVNQSMILLANKISGIKAHTFNLNQLKYISKILEKCGKVNISSAGAIP